MVDGETETEEIEPTPEPVWERVGELTQEESDLFRKLEVLTGQAPMLMRLDDPVGEVSATTYVLAIYYLTKNHGFRWFESEKMALWRYRIIDGKYIERTPDEHPMDAALGVWSKAYEMLVLLRAIARTREVK
jgi:hypothetical protein